MKGLTSDEVAKICDCASCPFARNGKPPHKPVLGEFNEKAVAILVGEGPGESEAREGRPFVGTTGKELDKQLLAAGIPRNKTILLNATACRPPIGKTDNMLGRATKSCAPLFQEQLMAARHNTTTPILAMGKWAAYAVTGKEQATEPSRGFLRDNNVIITWHPTYAFFRNPWVKGDFLIDLGRLKRLIDGKLQASPTVVTAPTMGDVHKLLDEIRANEGRVAVDIETGPEDGDSDGFTGKDPTRASLKTIAFGTDKYAVAFRWPIESSLLHLVLAILLDPSITKVFHNGYFFDLRVLSRYGIEVVNVIDTREIRRALVATSALALRYLAQTYVDFPAWKENEDEK